MSKYDSIKTAAELVATEQERTAATRLFNQSHRWLLTTGVPDTVRMTVQTFALWMKLGEFCASI